MPTPRSPRIHQRQKSVQAAFTGGLRTFGRETAKKDFDIDTNASELELLKDHIDAWKAKGCNNFARNMLYLLEDSGFRIERLVDDEENYDDASIKQADAAANAKWIEGILNAQDVEKHEYEVLTSRKLTPSNAAVVERYRIKHALNLESLTAADIEFYDHGRGPMRLKNFEFTAGMIPSYDLHPSRNDWALRDRAKARHLPRILAPLGLDFQEGTGTYGKAEAVALVDLVMEMPTYVGWLNVAPLHYDKRPKHAVKFANQIVRRLGLKTEVRQVRIGGDRERRYRLNQVVFEDVFRRAQRRNPPEHRI